MANQHVKCAPCKKSRKRCQCDLGRFLPEGEGEVDTNLIHDIYGLENLRKWVKRTDEKQKLPLVEALAWEAGTRVKISREWVIWGVVQELYNENSRLKQKVAKLERELKGVANKQDEMLELKEVENEEKNLKANLKVKLELKGAADKQDEMPELKEAENEEKKIKS
jgi:hypothetical protein